MRYTISEMASLLGVTTHTLRYYEKMGLIRPEVNEETGYRYYTVTDTRRFNLCRELRAAELSLEECRELIGSYSQLHKQSVSGAKVLSGKEMSLLQAILFSRYF